jgi:hypothetical protein
VTNHIFPLIYPGRDDEYLALEPGYYWTKDGGNPHLSIMKWSPECGQHGLWSAAGIDGGFDPEYITVCSSRIKPPDQA